MSPSPRPEHLLAAILFSTEDGLVSFALDGTIQNWSQGAARLYGYSTKEMVGESLARILPLHEVPTFEEFLNNMRKGNFAGCEHAERLRKDGTRIQMTFIHRQIRDENEKIIAVLEIAQIQRCHAENPVPDADARRVLEQIPQSCGQRIGPCG